MGLKDLLIGNKDGKTLLEHIFDGEKDAPRPEARLYNPLHLALHDLVELRFEEAGTYEVIRLTNYATYTLQTTHHAVRYFLRDTTAVEQTDEPLVLEFIRTEEGQAPEQYLFHIIETLAYDDEFMELLDDDVFIITEETDDETYEKDYGKTFHVTSNTTTVGPNGQTRYGTAKIWNYERDEEMETLYLVIEVDNEDGWTTIYEGRKLLGGELEVFPLSGGVS